MWRSVSLAPLQSLRRLCELFYMDELDWAHPVMPMPKCKRIHLQSSLGHVSLSIIPASPETFSFPSVQQLLHHSVVTVAGHKTISCSPVLRLRRWQHGLVQSVPAVTAPQGQLWHVAVWLQSDSLSSHALTAREGHHTSLDTHEQHSFASREDILFGTVPGSCPWVVEINRPDGTL